MKTLRDIFHRPTTQSIGGVNFIVYKLAFDQFDDAIEFGKWLESIDEKGDVAAQAAAIKRGSPMREVLTRLVAGCLCIPPADLGLDPSAAAVFGAGSRDGSAGQLQPADIELMPAVMLADSVAVLMETNADFFFQTLPSLLTRVNRMKSTGSQLLSNLSAQGMPASASAG